MRATLTIGLPRVLSRDIVERRLPACELFTSRALLDELAEKLHDKFVAWMDHTSSS